MKETKLTLAIDKIISKYKWQKIYQKKETGYLELKDNSEKVFLSPMETLESIRKRLRVIIASTKINIGMENACLSFEEDVFYLDTTKTEALQKKEKISTMASVTVFAELQFPIMFDIEKKASQVEREEKFISEAIMAAQTTLQETYTLDNTGAKITIDSFMVLESWENADTKVKIFDKDGKAVLEKFYKER